jgi:carbon-monoxide dehydrogenase iron sulfur subunit
MKVIYPIEERCINCHLCEVACILEHTVTKTPVAAYTTEKVRFNREESSHIPDPAVASELGKPKPLTRCFVEENYPINLSTNCRHCEEPACLLACKNGSLYKNDLGHVLVDEKKCVGCWMCMMACPYGAISRNPTKKNMPGVASNGINHHCDLCPERDTPACVFICPTKAIVYEDRG